MLEYNDALNAIYDNDRIKDKLRIEWIYDEFYNRVLNHVDASEEEEYTLIMEKTLKLLAETMNIQRDSDLDMEKFMRLYFDLLKSSGYFSTISKRKIIEDFEKSLSNIILPIDIDSIKKLHMNILRLEYKNIMKDESTDFKSYDKRTSFDTIKYDDVRNYIAQFNKDEQNTLMLSIIYSAFKSDEYSDEEICADLDVSKEHMKKAISNVISLFERHLDDFKTEEILSSHSDIKNKEYRKKY